MNNKCCMQSFQTSLSVSTNFNPFPFSSPFMSVFIILAYAYSLYLNTAMKMSSFSVHIFTSPANLSYSCILLSLSSLSLFSNLTRSALADFRWDLNKVSQNGFITFPGLNFKLIHNLQQHVMPGHRWIDNRRLGQVRRLRILRTQNMGKGIGKMRPPLPPQKKINKPKNPEQKKTKPNPNANVNEGSSKLMLSTDVHL